MTSIYFQNLSKIGFNLFIRLGGRKYLNWLSDTVYLKILYFLYRGEFLNIKQPELFSEKMQWLKINQKDNIYTKLVDKYEVRDYVKNKIGSEYLIELIGVYRGVDEINFQELPEKFILKTTHGSSQNYICKNKKDINVSLLKLRFDRWLNYCLYDIFREWSYKDVEPRIICEKFIESDEKSLTDYKFYCFDGKVDFVQVITDRENGVYKKNYYDKSWKELDFYIGEKVENVNILPPSNFQEMIKIAESLSAEIAFVRVDLYNVQGQILFGEMTFYPSSGLRKIRPHHMEKELGKKIDLKLI
ncbi:ATP-grasp fold amidoligase family protein [Kistimonas asteriae]|uniref:ATP-grasp fold amidoligase family protein n=1 Tax=Kistimonas asteriae TaxID=517724 RepID=UPI001BACF6E4|nr:ATP-grasp fold amidoligase family protein [Kistimonas asteriae]